MGITMNEKKLKVLANELAKDLKKQEDLSALSRNWQKHSRSYTQYEHKGRHTGNSRNGYSSKTLKGDHGSIEIETPRDRNASIEPQIVAKGQTRITGMDDQVLTLYDKGMSTPQYDMNITNH